MEEAADKQTQAAADRLRNGGVVAFPTETVYGLGADALNADAVAKVFAIKGRPPNNPLIVHVDGQGMARTLVRDWPDAASRLTEAFWPGPLTLVLPKAQTVPDIVTAGRDTVALRCPDHPLALALIRAFGGPIVGPSANPSGRTSPTTAGHVRESLPDVPVLDGGPCREGIESTVLQLAGPRPRILRPGVIGATQITQILGQKVDYAPGADPGQPAGPAPDASGGLPSPGLLPRHYAPATPAALFDPHEWPGVLERAAPTVAVISHEDRDVPPPHRLIRLPADAAGYARALYAAVREADAAGASAILIEKPPDSGPDRRDPGIWQAIHDRLQRLTAPRGAGEEGT